MENKKISVIVPIYNAEKWLSRCLNSILNNSYENLEVICVNDGSTDGSLELLMEFAQKDKRVVLVDQANGGVSAARNKGLDISTGEYISFVDADDWIHLHYFEKLLRICIDCCADIAVCSYAKTTSFDDYFFDQNISSEATYLSIADMLNNEHLKYTVTWRLYRKNVIGTQRFDVGLKLGEDTAFNLSVVCRCDYLKMYYLQEKLYYYFQRENSAVHTLDYTTT